MSLLPFSGICYPCINILFTGPFASGSFPRIFGLPVHAYLVYRFAIVHAYLVYIYA
jgi:hypothetical protein